MEKAINVRISYLNNGQPRYQTFVEFNWLDVSQSIAYWLDNFKELGYSVRLIEVEQRL